MKTVFRWMMSAGVVLFLALPPLSVQAQLPDFVQLVSNHRPSVVNINTVKVVQPRPGPRSPQEEFFQEFFERFFQGQQPMRPRQQRSLGSGFIISKDGYILTNNHVVEGADQVNVTLSDGRTFPGRIEGLDPKLDLALLKIDAEVDLPVAELGDSDALQVGEWVLAIGNPFGLETTVTAGIVSAKERVIGAGPYDNFIQTDASINPGNSGGPLFNMRGEVVGINTAMVAGGQGIGFASPINAVKQILPELKEKGEVTRGWLGVGVQGLTADLAASFGLDSPRGALVTEVMPDSPAAQAGLRRGDILLSFDGQPVQQVSDLPRMVAATPVGHRADLTVYRDGEEIRIPVTVGRLEEPGKKAEPRNGATDTLGLTVRDITPDAMRFHGLESDRGALVTAVDPAGPAAEAELRPGDVVIEVNGREIAGVADFRSAVEQRKSGQTLRLLVRRGESVFYTTLMKP